MHFNRALTRSITLQDANSTPMNKSPKVIEPLPTLLDNVPLGVKSSGKTFAEQDAYMERQKLRDLQSYNSRTGIEQLYNGSKPKHQPLPLLSELIMVQSAGLDSDEEDCGTRKNKPSRNRGPADVDIDDEEVEEPLGMWIAQTMFMLSSLGFVLGSIYCILERPVLGCYIFGVSCVIIIPASIITLAFDEIDTGLVLSATYLISGCIAFAIPCFFPTLSATIAISCYCLGSLAFLIHGNFECLRQGVGIFGPKSSLYPNGPRATYPLLTHQLGSVLFVAGSLAFSSENDSGIFIGNWLFLIGSLHYVLSTFWVISEMLTSGDLTEY